LSVTAIDITPVSDNLDDQCPSFMVKGVDDSIVANTSPVKTTPLTRKCKVFERMSMFGYPQHLLEDTLTCCLIKTF
jgi:hypothetical protein